MPENQPEGFYLLTCPGCENTDITIVELSERANHVECDTCGFTGEIQDFMEPDE